MPLRRTLTRANLNLLNVLNDRDENQLGHQSKKKLQTLSPPDPHFEVHDRSASQKELAELAPLLSTLTAIILLTPT